MHNRVIAFCWLALFFVVISSEKASGAPVQDDRPKVGLVLSGGGARGFAHIGVISKLQEAGIPIDYITGSSMGSVIGALYAIGYSPEQMTEIAHTIDWDGSLSDSGPRQFRPIEEKRWDGKHLLSLPIKGLSVKLPSGLLEGQNIMNTLSRLTWPAHDITDFNEFSIPFATVATDLETGLPYVMRGGYLPDVLRASIALPTLFTPKVINGHTLIDGGLVMNVPAMLVREMGADIIITVDATSMLADAEELVNILDIMNQTVRFQMIKSNTEQISLSNVVISPDIKDHSILNFDNPGKLIQAGREAAVDQWTNLMNIADSQRLYDKPRKHKNMLSQDSVYIAEIDFEGLSDVSQWLALDQLDIEPGSWVSRQDIEKGISKLYGLEFFKSVNYNIISENRNQILIVNVKEREVDTFRFGFNYKNRKGASLYFNTTYRNLITPSSVLRISLGLGREPFIDGQYFNYVGQKSKFGLRSQLNYKQHDIDLYNHENRIFNIKANSFLMNVLIYPVISTNYVIGAGFREEAFNYSGSLGIGEFPYDWSNLHLPYLLFELDTFDDMLFPTRGHHIKAQSDFAIIPFASSARYVRHLIAWDGYLPVNERGSVVARMNLGLTANHSLPLHQRFFMGGHPSFLGYYPQEFSGDQVKSLQMGYQLRFDREIYAYVAGNIGSTNFTWGENPFNDEYFTGAGITLKTSTRLGPMGITFSTSTRHNFLVELNGGFRF
ncbi:MAG: patatin-like phospholipase family protein [Balneolales bacterium]